MSKPIDTKAVLVEARQSILARHYPEDQGWAENLVEELANALSQEIGQREALERPRAEVRAFALLMETELAKHDYRPGWKTASTGYLLDRLAEEYDELFEIFQWGEGGDVGAEAADVANFAMMIADGAGALREADDALPTP